jgi:hypothetical protein
MRRLNGENSTLSSNEKKYLQRNRVSYIQIYAVCNYITAPGGLLFSTTYRNHSCACAQSQTVTHLACCAKGLFEELSLLESCEILATTTTTNTQQSEQTSSLLPYCKYHL